MPIAEITQYSSPLVLTTFALVGSLLGLLYKTGLLALILRGVFGMANWFVSAGYRVWDRFLSGAPWYAHAGILVAVHLLRLPVSLPPLITAGMGAILLTVGAITVLAYMFIDTERYEVSRGYKALHSPAKGQKLAEGLTRHGDRVGYALLVTAIVMCISGFSLMNLGLYESVGQDWYSFRPHHSRDLEAEGSGIEEYADYTDFLASTLLNLAYLLDLLDLLNKSGEAGIADVRPKYWPASALLASFRLFFSFVLLQQLVSLVRHGRLLSESVQDLWSPYEPIQRRAAAHLEQQGPDAVSYVLASVEAIAPLTPAQLDMVPRVIAEIGPATVPILTGNLNHPLADVRAVAVAALGHLKAWWALPALLAVVDDSSAEVRLALAEAIERSASPGTAALRKHWALGRAAPPRRPWIRLVRRKEIAPVRTGRDPVELCLTILRALLRDGDERVRLKAAQALVQLGPEGAPAAGEVFELAREADEGLRAAAAEALGCINPPPKEALAALLALLDPPSPAVVVPVLRSLGTLGRVAALAVPRIVPFVRDEDEQIRTAAAEAISAIGQLDASVAPLLVEELANEDDTARARAAEALGVIGPAAANTAPALIKALLGDRNDRVRAEAALALGKLGPEPAVDSVPALARALADPDSVVAVHAARALDLLGDVAVAAVAELRQALRHVNAELRRQVVATFADLGPLSPDDVAALVPLLQDEEGEVRRQVVRTLGTQANLPPPARQALLDTVADPEPEVRIAAVDVLGRPNADGTTVHRLLAALGDPSSSVQAAAARVLGDLRAPAPEVVEAVGGLLEDPSEEVRLAAAAALGQFGQRAAGLAPELRKLIEEQRGELREQAFRSLVQVAPEAHFELFAEAMHDPSEAIRRLASAGLMKLKELPPGIVGVLADGLRDPDPQVCANIAFVCTKLESLPAELVPLLLAHVSSPDDGLRLIALRAVGSVPVTGDELLLEHLLDDPNLQIALQTAAVLLQRDPQIPALEEVLVRALQAAAHYREQAIRLLDMTDPLQPGVPALLDRLRERVSDPEVRLQLTRLLARPDTTSVER